jgi:hypothetical protein
VTLLERLAADQTARGAWLLHAPVQWESVRPGRGFPGASALTSVPPRFRLGH